MMPQYRITQGSIGIIQFDESSAADSLIGMGVRVDLNGFSAKGRFDLPRIGLGAKPQNAVGVSRGVGGGYKTECPGSGG